MLAPHHYPAEATSAEDELVWAASGYGHPVPRSFHGSVQVEVGMVALALVLKGILYRTDKKRHHTSCIRGSPPPNSLEFFGIFLTLETQHRALASFMSFVNLSQLNRVSFAEFMRAELFAETLHQF